MENNNLKEKFYRVAEKRVQNIIEKIELLESCSNRNAYSYDQEDVEKMFNAIELSLRKCKMSFNSGSTRDSKFKF